MNILKNEYISTTIGKLSTMLGTILTTILLNRYLGPSLRGEYALVINQMVLVTSVLNLGIPHIYHYFYRKSSKYFIIFKNLIFTQFIILILLNIFIQFFFKINNSTRIILILIPIVILAQQINIISLVSDLNKRNVNNIYTTFFNIAFWIFIFICSKQNIILPYLAYAFKEIFFCIISFKLIDFKLKEYRFELKEWKSIIIVAFVPMLTMILNTMNYRVDTIILGYTVDTFELGLYSAALSITEIAWIFPDIFKEIMFSKSAKNDSIDVICRSIKFTLIINFIMILGIIIFGKIIIFILMGKEYLSAYNVIILLFFGIPSMSFFKIINPVYLANGERSFAFKTLLIAVVVNVGFNFILIPYLGISGAAIGSIFSYTICGIIFLFSFVKRYNVKLSDLFIINKEDIEVISEFFVNKGVKEKI